MEIEGGGSSACAVVLAGAVSQGAFEACALEVLTSSLAERGCSIRTVVGASAGALNGAVLAEHVRRGDAVGGAEALVELWRERGSWCSFLAWPACSCDGFRGVLPTEKVVALVRGELASLPRGQGAEVDLRLIVTVLEGRATEPRHTAGAPVDPCCQPTSFEAVVEFTERDFDDDDGRDRIAEAAAASASFPGLFVPRQLPGVGACLDGGIVNNTPVSEALKGRSRVETVFVIVPYPRSLHGPIPSGIGFAGRVAELLIHERLHRDLREAEAVNHWLRRLQTLVQDPVAREEVIAELYPIHRTRPLRVVELVEIRPCAPLEGTAFSGFGCRCVRERYLDAGREAARRVLADREKRRERTC